MPLPLILGAAAAVAGAAGVGSAIHGGVKMKKANDTMKQTQEAHTANVRRFEIRNERCTAAMDRLGKLELEILQSFQKFSDIFERIQNSRRAAVLVARVKRQVDGLSARVTDVKRVVLPQFLGGDIADRRLTLGLERQSPIADSRGNRLFGGCRLSIFARKQDENRGQNRKNAKSHTDSAQTRACDRDKHSSALPCSTLCGCMGNMPVFLCQFAAGYR